MKKQNTHLAVALFALALGLFGLDPVWAQTSIGSVADKVVADGTFSALVNVMSGAAYLIGVVFGIKSAVQLKDHTYNPQQVKLTKPVVSMAVCGILLSLPSFFGMLQSTFDMANGNGALGFAGLSAGSPGTAGDLGEMFKAFSTNIPALMKIVSFGAICAGAFMILRAILLLPQVEQGRAEGSKVLWMLISGIGLWSILPMITMSMNTAGMSGGDAVSLLNTKYSQAQGGGFDGTIAAVMVFVQLLGLIAFVRGTLILKALGENKDGAMGRAMTHIFGGAAAMNVAWTVKLLAVSIGASGTICGISVNLCA